MESHVIDAIVEGQRITDFISGNIESSIITPCDSFVLRMPASVQASNAFRRGAKIAIRADGTTLIRGFIGKRHYSSRTGVLEIRGRDICGRLADESAPAIDYTGMTIERAIAKLLSPWFPPPALSNAKNRRLRRGKGKRIASPTEPVVTINVKVPRSGKVHPGQSRMDLIHEILSRAKLVGYSSSDGTEFIIGKPNQSQSPQYSFIYAEGDPDSNVKDLQFTEDDEERYSEYLCAGAGGQGELNYGKNVVDNRGVVFDNPFNRIDGTGRDFIHPKRLFLPEKAFDSYGDAQRVAENEQARRDYHRHIATAEMASFGQDLGTSQPTLFAPDTVARVIDRKMEVDDLYYVVSCSYSWAHDVGDTCYITMVPVGTEIIL